MCVMPTPFTHASANDGRSVRRAVDPMKTMRTEAVVAEDGALSLSQPRATPISNATTATGMPRRSMAFYHPASSLHLTFEYPDRNGVTIPASGSYLWRHTHAVSLARR